MIAVADHDSMSIFCGKAEYKLSVRYLRGSPHVVRFMAAATGSRNLIYTRSTWIVMLDLVGR